MCPADDIRKANDFELLGALDPAGLAEEDVVFEVLRRMRNLSPTSEAIKRDLTDRFRCSLGLLRQQVREHRIPREQLEASMVAVLMIVEEATL
jgi:hypothetical protein